MGKPSTPLIADLQAGSGQNRITSTRLWNVTNLFFVSTADVIEAESPKTAEKLRHASVSATSVYLNTDQAKRARQMRDAFGTPNT